MKRMENAKQQYENISVICTMANVLMFRSYEKQVDDINISVDIPSVELISKELKGLEKNVNEDIYEFCNQYAEEATKRAYEYRQAFLETGGTEGEWAKNIVVIRVQYEVVTKTEQYLWLKISGTEGWTSAYNEAKYYNFDMKAGKWITLKKNLG